MRERAPAYALMEKLVSLRDEPGWIRLPLGIVRPSNEGMSWLRGINGELKMAKRLERLGPEWTVLHSVPVGERGSDIDHLVIGPAGVFPINTKRHLDKSIWVASGTLLVGGHPTNYVRNSAFEAKRVETVLRRARIVAPILPIIAISGARTISKKADARWDGRTVAVVDLVDVAWRLRRRPPKLSAEQVNEVVRVCSDSTSWSRTAGVPGDPATVRRAFAAIDRGVTRWNLLMRALFGVFVVAVVMTCSMWAVNWLRL